MMHGQTISGEDAMTPRIWTACFAAVALLAACAPAPTETGEEALATELENGSFTVELDGFPIHYEVHGHGPVVMTVPNSWGLSFEGLRALYRPLEGRLTMVYFDPRGMGESGSIREDADMGLAAVRADFDGLRRHLGLDTVTAMGWSNGAMNLILLAAEYPDSIERAIFVHGAASFTQEDWQLWAEKQPEMIRMWVQLEQELQAEGLTDEERTARQKTFWVSEFFPMSCADPDAARPMLEEIYRDVEFSWRHGQYSNQESPEFDARDLLADIRARCLVVAGQHDMLTPEKVRELHDGLPDSEFAVFEASGHFAPVEQPDAFRSLIYGFLGVGGGA
jgi:proline iminopeptidase